MKPIKADKIKVGGYISTEKIFGYVDNKNYIHEGYVVAYVEKIEKSKSKDPKIKKDIYVKPYSVRGDEITKGGDIGGGKIYLLGKEEAMKFKKRLILETLEK